MTRSERPHLRAVDALAERTQATLTESYEELIAVAARAAREMGAREEGARAAGYVLMEAACAGARAAYESVAEGLREGIGRARSEPGGSS